MILFRLDAGIGIGGGHLTRCGAIAAECVAMGRDVLFVVSNERSMKVVESRGWPCMSISGDERHLGGDDGHSLAQLANSVGADAVLTDSYGVSAEYFEVLKSHCASFSGYLEDGYRYGVGFLGDVARLNVDLVVDFGFDVSETDYDIAYRGRGVQLLLGCHYAPVRKEFRPVGSVPPEEVRNVVVTVGATNPSECLETITESVARYSSDYSIQAVVGPEADVHAERLSLPGIKIVCNPPQIWRIFGEADLVFSAAGGTLFELSALGVPTFAIAVVANQERNVEAFTRLGLGLGVRVDSVGGAEFFSLVNRMVGVETRNLFSARMRQLVDGKGAERVARALSAAKR